VLEGRRAAGNTDDEEPARRELIEQRVGDLLRLAQGSVGVLALTSSLSVLGRFRRANRIVFRFPAKEDAKLGHKAESLEACK
jgi:hypothetical protein